MPTSSLSGKVVGAKSQFSIQTDAVSVLSLELGDASLNPFMLLRTLNTFFASILNIFTYVWGGGVEGGEQCFN